MHGNRMIHQLGQPLHDRKPQPQPILGKHDTRFPLPESFENRFPFRHRAACAAVAYQQCQRIFPAAAADQDAAPRRVFQRVCQKIAQDQFQQLRIGLHMGRAGNKTQLQISGFALRSELVRQRFHQRAGRRPWPRRQGRQAGGRHRLE